MSERLLIHHAANRGHNHPAGSLAALEACLAAGALVVELDILPLRDGGWALLHDNDLSKGTDGRGLATALTTEAVRRCRYRQRGRRDDEPVGLLAEAIARVADNGSLVELQLDLKPYGRPTLETMHSLARAVQPVRERVRVTSGADWALRLLGRADPALALGFDALLYLDLHRGAGEDEEPPFRLGAYGLRDDHPLAAQRWGSMAEYLTLRLEALLRQAPPGACWYVDAELLALCLDQGCDWIETLHREGCLVDAWTLDPDRPERLALARRLLACGVDRITTNQAPQMAALLGDVRY
jgi:glycerophosphoryl diester phosphodiesterase